MEACNILLLFVVLFYSLSTLSSNKIIRGIIAFIGACIITLQIISLYFTQTFIGYQFYVHCNLNAINGFSEYFSHHILFAIIIFFGLMYFFYKTFIPNNIISKTLIFFCIILSSFGILSNPTFRKDSRTLISLFSNEAISFQRTLNKNDMSKYTLARHIECYNNTPKNIIVLSLESYEKLFIEDDDFKYLTPNLRKLKNDWSYTTLIPNTGSSWTSGSIYTYLTGFPAFFGIHGNSIFQTSYHTEIASVSQILKQTNHNTFYLIGNAEHSGLKDMLTTLSIDSIIDDRCFENVYPESNYGLRDKDLFEIAKSLIIEQKNKKEHFAIFISTTDTHAPNGIYDKRMENIVNQTLCKNDLEFMIAAVDFMIGDFVHFLEQKNILENTTIFIFPDHLKMGDPTIFKNKKRELFLLSNLDHKTLKINLDKKIYQIDLPEIILNGADIHHNAKFLTNFIGNDSNYLEKHIEQLTAININGLLRSDSTRIPNRFKKQDASYK